MTTLEKKVDAIARHLLAHSPAEQRRTLEELRELLAGKRTIGSVREYFGNTISPNKGKLTNSEFIARLASVIRERTGG